jgi:hypothetical protein
MHLTRRVVLFIVYKRGAEINGKFPLAPETEQLDTLIGEYPATGREASKTPENNNNIGAFGSGDSMRPETAFDANSTRIGHGGADRAAQSSDNDHPVGYKLSLSHMNAAGNVYKIGAGAPLASQIRKQSQ